jgi:Na+/H+-translocating membrane pyrophosphatase
MITGMAVSLLIALSSQIMTSHPFFLYALLGSCKTGAATCLIYGISFGYLYNVFPIVGLVGITYLWYWWLGSFGVAMGGIGVAMYIVINMTINGYFTSV